MSLKNLNLVHFRNYEQLELNFNDDINIFVGANAQGKTNIIESIFINAVGKSHRTGADNDLIKLNKETAKIKLTFSKLTVLNSNEFIFFRNARRKILKNGKSTTTGRIIGSFNAVLFSPEDLMLIKGSPNLRRKFLDREISQADPTYYDNLCKLTRIIAQRNKLLKEIREGRAAKNTLFPWDEQFSLYATAIVKKRLKAVDKLAAIAAKMHETISEQRETLVIAYDIHEKNAEFIEQNAVNWYFNELGKRQNADIMRGTTGIGPQHDELLTYINGNSLKAYGSQGQQRTAVLALKLAELRFLHDETGEYPVLLLDDVMSELDANRRQSLADFLLKEKIQTVITATDESFFTGWQNAAMWQVENGTVKKSS